MELKSKDPNTKSLSVFVRITPEMNRELGELAKVVGGGVATVMRQIVENALAEGIKVTKPRKAAARSTNGEQK